MLKVCPTCAGRGEVTETRREKSSEKAPDGTWRDIEVEITTERTCGTCGGDRVI